MLHTVNRTLVYTHPLTSRHPPFGWCTSQSCSWRTFTGACCRGSLLSSCVDDMCNLLGKFAIWSKSSDTVEVSIWRIGIFIPKCQLRETSRLLVNTFLHTLLGATVTEPYSAGRGLLLWCLGTPMKIEIGNYKITLPFLTCYDWSSCSQTKGCSVFARCLCVYQSVWIRKELLFFRSLLGLPAVLLQFRSISLHSSRWFTGRVGAHWNSLVVWNSWMVGPFWMFPPELVQIQWVLRPCLQQQFLQFWCCWPLQVY